MERTQINVSEHNVTWKDEDEEGADAPNHTDDLADVRHKHGDEQCRYYPQNRQHVAAAAFQLRYHPAIAPSPPAQQGFLDHWPVLQEQEGLWIISFQEITVGNTVNQGYGEILQFVLTALRMRWPLFGITFDYFFKIKIWLKTQYVITM